MLCCDHTHCRRTADDEVKLIKVQREMRDKANRLQALQAKYNTLEQVGAKIGPPAPSQASLSLSLPLSFSLCLYVSLSLSTLPLLSKAIMHITLLRGND